MYRKKDGKIFGVLNDYDLAILKANNTPSSRACTGTRPFMAIDLLGKPTDLHRYRHDLESMFYVIVYVTSRYHNGQEIDDPPLQDWEELREEALKAAKKGFLSDALPPRTDHYHNFSVWTRKMRVAILNGRSALAIHCEQTDSTLENTPIFDVETLGGHVSFTSFGEIFGLSIE